MTCSFLQPGQVSFRKMGRLAIGKHPKGAHPFSKKLGAALEEAGFDVTVSNSIVCDKWLKLVVNLQSAFNAIIDPRDHDGVEFVDLKGGCPRGGEEGSPGREDEDQVLRRAGAVDRRRRERAQEAESRRGRTPPSR